MTTRCVFLALTTDTEHEAGQAASTGLQVSGMTRPDFRTN